MRHPIAARRFTFGLLLLGTVWALPARAEVPAIDEAGARTMAAAIKDGLARRFPAPAPADDDIDGGGGTVWEWDGAPTVTPAGDHYEVALPALTVEDGEGRRIGVGTIRLTVAPRDGGTYAVTATLPDRIPFLEQDDEGEDYRETGAVTIGRQRFTGLWSGAYQTLVTMDATFGDLAATDADGKGSVTVGAVTLMQDLKPDDTAGGAAGAATWSGPAAFAFNNVAVRDERKRDVLTLGGLTAEMQSLHVDMARAAQMQQTMQLFGVGTATPQAAGLVSAMHGLAAGGSSRLRLSDLSLRDPKDGTRVAFGQLAISNSVDGLDKEQSTVALGVEARGFSMTPAPGPDSFIPRNLDLQLSFAKLPNAVLWQALTDLAAIADAKKAEGDGDGEVLKGKPGAKGNRKPVEDPTAPIVQRVSAALAQAGAELRIERLELDSPLAAGSASGNARYAPEAPMGAVGGATVRLRGLDAVTKALQPEPGKKADKDTQQTLGVLALLQTMGQLSKDEAGNDVRTYQIDVTDAGQMTLNGADLAPLLGGGVGAASEEKPAPKKKKN